MTATFLQTMNMPRIPFRQFYAISFLALFAILNPALATPPDWKTALSDKLTASEKEIRSRVTDLRKLAPNLRGLDRDVVKASAIFAQHPLCQIDLIHELLVIDSGGIDPATRTYVESRMDDHLERLGDFVEGTVDYISGSIGDMRNQAAILAVSKLRDDLRGLKDLQRLFQANPLARPDSGSHQNAH